MAAAQSTCPVPPADPASQRAVAAVARAIDLLSRASSDWRNGGQSAEGALHWPVACNHGRRVLREALEALEPARWPQEQAGTDDDTRAGIAWFNALSPAARRYWLEVADSAVPADAWRAFQTGAAAPLRPTTIIP